VRLEIADQVRNDGGGRGGASEASTDGRNAYTGVKPSARPTVHVNSSRLKPAARPIEGARGKIVFPPV
jgi:hypothetical protein